MKQLCKNNLGEQKSCQNRIAGLDFIRVFASLFTIAGHFFVLNTPFKSTIFDGSFSLFVQAMANFIFKGTPFFMLLSGFLLSTKTFDKKYYRRGIKVILSYLFFSVVTVLFRKYYLHEDLSWLKWGLKILDFSAIPYAWYIEMWIGLFLLSPYLNLLYRNIETKRLKLGLVGVLIFLTAVPIFTNRYGLHLMPGFWSNIYPLTFYFIGAFIREYHPRCPFKIGIPIVLLIATINPIFNCLFVKNHTLIQIMGDPNGIFGLVNSVIIFLMFYNVDIKSQRVKLILSKLAQATLGIYLCCYIFDALYYPYFIKHFFVSQQQFGLYFFIVVPLIFLSSFIVARLKDFIFKLVKLDRL